MLIEKYMTFLVMLSCHLKTNRDITDIVVFCLSPSRAFHCSIKFIDFTSETQRSTTAVPERSAKASRHVLPQIFTVHGAHQHVHCLYDL